MGGGPPRKKTAATSSSCYVEDERLMEEREVVVTLAIKLRSAPGTEYRVGPQPPLAISAHC